MNSSVEEIRMYDRLLRAAVACLSGIVLGTAAMKVQSIPVEPPLTLSRLLQN